jgi:hypothetical protein
MKKKIKITSQKRLKMAMWLIAWPDPCKICPADYFLGLGGMAIGIGIEKSEKTKKDINTVRDGFCHYFFPELKEFQDGLFECGPCPCKHKNIRNPLITVQKYIEKQKGGADETNEQP